MKVDVKYGTPDTKDLALFGQWRIEVSPSTPRKQDNFLHVIQVGDQKLTAMDKTELIESAGRSGVRLKSKDKTWTVTFNTRGELGGHITCQSPSVKIDQDLTTAVQTQVGINAGTNEKTMTYLQAMQRIPVRDLPEFWMVNIERINKFLSQLKIGSVSTIATTPGKRSVHLISYGELEPLVNKANFNSAIGGRKLSAYMDKEARSKPVILFVGPVHGQEVENLIGLTNFINVMETGLDLRGKDQGHLRELGQKCRLLIIPEGNPDGIARYKPGSMVGMKLNDIRFWGQGTWSDNTYCSWPEAKRQHPMTGDNVGFLGCYFNDAGINPMHDEFFAPMGPEAPAILNVARREGPDLAVSLHSHSTNPALLRPAYVPIEVQQSIRLLGQRYNALLKVHNLPNRKKVFEPGPEQGRRLAPFNLTSALYHISGAESFTFECPQGITDKKACPVSHDHILDIQLLLYQAMIEHALLNENTNPDESGLTLRYSTGEP